eukprot:170135-Rhodomonas_salina.5
MVNGVSFCKSKTGCACAVGCKPEEAEDRDGREAAASVRGRARTCEAVTVMERRFKVASVLHWHGGGGHAEAKSRGDSPGAQERAAERARG